MTGCLFRGAYRLCLSALILFFISGSAYPQSVSALTGRWVWKEIARKNKPQTQFTLVIHHDRDVVRGTYSVDEFIKGEWQGEDGNQTPFRGRLVGRGAQIEFDPSATSPGYEQNVTYKPPADGRKPSVAIIMVKGGRLLWNLVTGSSIDRVPRKLVLHRERRPK
jgi:hypothetical protein